MALSTSTEPEIELPPITAAPDGGTTTVVGFDPEDPDSTPWVVANQPRSSMVIGNEVIPYVRSEKLFPDVVSAFRTATSGAHFIWIAGWNLSDTRPRGPGTTFQLVPGDATTSILNLFNTANTAGVRIRVILFRHDTISNARDNSEVVTFVNGLSNGMAILDDHVVAGLGAYSAYVPGVAAGAHYVGAHHQKIIVVSGSDGLVAFQGGYDLDQDRISTGVGGPGLHDVHCRIRGIGAKSLADAFVERWNDHPSVTTAHRLASVPTPPALPDNKTVQIAHTFPNVGNHPLNGGGTYGFAPSGETTVKQMLLQAIRSARRFIYVEDQYLFDMDISNALRAALPNIQKLLILITQSGSIEGETLQPWARRKRFIDNLPATYTTTPPSAGPPPTAARTTYAGKVAVCQLATQYVHAKTWIFDDKFAVIASANVNRRGMTHDSEQAAGVYDPNHRRRWFFAHELRMNLWGKHFRRPPIDFRDPIASSVHWFTPIGDVISYNPDGGVDPDPLGLTRFGLTGLLRMAASAVLTNDGVWDSVVDPDGS